MRPELPVLIKARALIADPANWGKGCRPCGHPTLCAAEAIEASGRATDRRISAYRAVERAAGIHGNEIARWNDAPERTHADVMAAFDKAIASAS